MVVGWLPWYLRYSNHSALRFQTGFVDFRHLSIGSLELNLFSSVIPFLFPLGFCCGARQIYAHTPSSVLLQVLEIYVAQSY